MTTVLLAGRSSRARTAWLGAVLALLAFLFALSVAIGTRDVSFADILGGLSGRVETVAEAAVAVRLPRTLLALLSGAALGLAGAIMQGVTRNPLADPGILGVNMGASLAVVIGIVWFGIASAQAFIITAIVGAGASAVFVYVVGSLGRGGATPLKLALAGASTSVAFSSLVIAVVLPRSDIAGGIRSWQIGGVGGATFERIETVLPFLAAGFIISLLSARKLNSLALGDELAAGLGENVMAARAVASFGAILLAAPPQPFAGRSVSSGWWCRISAACSLAWTIAGFCRSRRLAGRVCCLLPILSGASWRGHPNLMSASSPPSSARLSSSGLSDARGCANCDHARSRHRNSRLQPPRPPAPASPCRLRPVGAPDRRFLNNADARAILHAAR